MADSESGASHRGHCLCGAVRFRIDTPLAPVVGCHCTICRRQSGHFVATTNVAAADLHFEGDHGLAWYAASDAAKRGLCRECGSFLFWRQNGSDRIAIAMGSLDLPTGVRFGRHIFVADKGDYYDIDPGAPQFPGDG